MTTVSDKTVKKAVINHTQILAIGINQKIENDSSFHLKIKKKTKKASEM